MEVKSGLKENKVYVLVAIFVIFVIVLTIIFSGGDITPARIPLDALDNDWSEDISNSSKEEGFLGLERFFSVTYRCDNDSFPAYVTVSTTKNFFMMSEEDLVDETEDLIVRKTSEQNIVLNKKTRFSGERTLKNGHKSSFFVYNATKNLGDNSENVKIIGEAWNCEKSGTSVVCIGMAQISNSSLNVTDNSFFWSKIVRDNKGTFGSDEFKGNDGLIFNVICH